MPTPPDSWDRFQTLIDKGDIAAAIGLLDAELAIAQDNREKALALERIGWANLHLGNFTEASKAYQSAIDALHAANNPLLRRLYLGLGYVFQQKQSFAEALSEYSKGIEKAIDHAHEIIKGDRANPAMKSVVTVDGKKTLLFTGTYLQRIKDICTLDPIFAATRNNMGVCLMELNDLQWAEKMFLEAIEFIPQGTNYPTPSKNLLALRKERDDDIANKSKNPYLDANPANWMLKALSDFKKCPRCKTDDYVIFDGCRNCGYKNSFAEYAIDAVPGTMASFAAWDTMFEMEIIETQLGQKSG